MKTTLNFYSEKNGEIKKFLEQYYSKNLNLKNNLICKIEYDNPVEMIDLISCFVDNKQKFNINLWLCLDEDVYICVSDNNINNLIKYIYERYPY